MNGLEIITFLRKSNGWIEKKTICREIYQGNAGEQSNLNKQLNQLYKFGFIEIIVDGKKHWIRLKEGEIDDVHSRSDSSRDRKGSSPTAFIEKRS